MKLRNEGREMIDKVKILVGVDGSPMAGRALAEAVSIAKRFSGSVKVITVYDQGLEDKAEEILGTAKQSCENELIECTTSSILGSNPARALQDTAKSGNFDLIVVGNRGLGKTASILMGSVSRQIVATAECNVLVVKK
jgi:nucleotide-binding universal stress UspA family protein